MEQKQHFFFFFLSGNIFSETTKNEALRGLFLGPLGIFALRGWKLREFKFSQIPEKVRPQKSKNQFLKKKINFFYDLGF